MQALPWAFAVVALACVVWTRSPIVPTSRAEIGFPVFEIANSTSLQSAEHLFEGSMLAPEDIAVSPDEGRSHLLYLSLGDGRIVTMNSNDPSQGFEEFVQTGTKTSSCGSLDSEAVCGRPLGMKFLPAKYFSNYLTPDARRPSHVLVVCDAYRGLLLVDFDRTIISLLTEVDRTPLRFANSLVMDEEQGGGGGVIYLSDSSARFRRNQVAYEMLEGGATGRLIKFNPTTGEATTVLRNLSFPNGLAMFDERSLLLSLSLDSKIARYWFHNESLTTFAELPGFPDNLDILTKANGDKLVLVGLASKHSGMSRMLNRYPSVRRVVASVLPYQWLLPLLKAYGIFAVVDGNTQQVRTFEDPSGRTADIAGVHVIHDDAWITTWKNHFLARIPARVLF